MVGSVREKHVAVRSSADETGIGQTGSIQFYLKALRGFGPRVSRPRDNLESVGCALGSKRLGQVASCDLSEHAWLNLGCIFKSLLPGEHVFGKDRAGREH